MNSEVTSLNSRITSANSQEVFNVSCCSYRNLWIIVFRIFIIAGEFSGFRRKLLPPSWEKMKEGGFFEEIFL
jgi:hypothetical protein